MRGRSRVAHASPELQLQRPDRARKDILRAKEESSPQRNTWERPTPLRCWKVVSI